MPWPPYRELPSEPVTGLPTSWGLIPPGDDLGTLARIDAAATLAALAEPRQGVPIALTLPLNEPSPPLFGRAELSHVISEMPNRMLDDRLDSFFPQASSQWDGFRHVRAGAAGYYGGVQELPAGSVRLGVGAWARGILTRGVLVDMVAHYRSKGTPLDPASGYRIPAEDIAERLRVVDVSLRQGDLLLVRTGWLEAYRHGTSEEKEALRAASSGLHAGEATAELLWDAGVAAVAADNPALEALPADRAIGSLHRRLLPMLGMPIGELWALDDLAVRAAASGVATALVVSVPLNVPGGVGSPANAIAVV